MVQNQLVDYINAQMKAGVSRDAVKTALIGVGWQATDVEDSLKKAEGDMKPAAAPASAAVGMGAGAGATAGMGMGAARPMTSPAATSPVSNPTVAARPMAASTPISSPVAQAKPMGSFAVSSPAAGMGASPAAASSMGMGGAMKSPVASSPMGGSAFGARNLDIVGGAGSMKSPSAGPAVQPMKVNSFMSSGAKPAASPMGGSPMNNTTFTPTGDLSGGLATHHSARTGMIAEAVGLVALAALSIFFYIQNSSLTAKVNALGTATGGATTQASDLQTQVQTLTTSNGTLQNQVNSLTAQSNSLKTELSFVAVPTGMSAQAASGTIMGALTANGKFYILTTTDGVVVSVKNSTDPMTSAALKPLVGQSVTLSGSYTVGSNAFTVVSVNGNPVNAPAPLPSSTPMNASGTGQ